MINYTQLKNDLRHTAINDWYTPLVDAVSKRLESYSHGEFSEWESLINILPVIEPSSISLTDDVTVGTLQDFESQAKETSRQSFIQQLQKLHPWRKGPYSLFGTQIDTEWRSDWKWERIKPFLSNLEGRTILDVGCGNGYHCWRMFGEGAKLVLGIDPSQKFLAQFSIIKRYIKDPAVHLLPIGIEDMPYGNPGGFDSVFSMGVLYHRKSPIQHLLDLKALLNKSGELILETLIIDGDENQVLVPQDRYAQMRNVWFLPSIKALELWLARCGFKNIRTVDVNQTSLEEQRATDWMQFHSLENFLDPDDINRTIEGYPAPKRAVIIANNN